MGRVRLISRDAHTGPGDCAHGRLPRGLGLSPVTGTREHTPPTAGGGPVAPGDGETETRVPVDGLSNRHTAGPSVGTAHPPSVGFPEMTEVRNLHRRSC